MECPLLSIVIPTKNRYFYLKKCIELIKNFDLNDLELIIQDNSDDNSEFLDYLSRIDLPYLRYFYIKETISVADNSDKAILNSNGEYVCYIGDDDGVTRYVVDCTKWLKKNNFSILKSALTVYRWPSFVSPVHYDMASTISYHDYSMKYDIVSCKKSLDKLLKTGVDSLRFMPKVYNGIVRRSTLDKIYEKCGTYFPGPSPDMSNAVALALVEDYYVYLDAPIIIGGQSSHLGGNVARYKKGYGPLEEQPFISKLQIDTWDYRIPKIWASRTIWPESAITALKAFEKSDYIDKIDFNVIYRKLGVEHPELIKYVHALTSNKVKLYLSIISHKLNNYIFSIINFCKYKNIGVYGGLKFNRGYKDIIEAESYLVSKVGELRPLDTK